MSLQNYTQPQLSIDQQIQRLKSAGLNFRDEVEAKHQLSHIGYSRLKGYLYPLRQPGSKKFISSASYEQAMEFYRFDAALRNLLLFYLGKVEVSIRTQISFVLCDICDPFWFSDPGNFRNSKRHTLILEAIRHEIRRSDDDGIVHFFNTYSDPIPPSWRIMEAISFGTVSKLYKELNAGLARRQIAKRYGISDTVMESWLHALVYVRNICAHHSRLWNRNLRIKPLTPHKTRNKFLSSPASTQNLYFILSIVIYFLQIVQPDNAFVSEFKKLLRKYSNIDTSAMGFPENWETEFLWN